MTPPIWNGAGSCINDNTTLPHAKVQKGDQFVVYSPPGKFSHVPGLLAVDIREDDVFGVYERGMGVSSLLQPGQPGPLHIFVDPDPSLPFNGVYAKICDHPAWGAVIVSGVIGSDDWTAGTAYHELFHAAQAALLGFIPSGNWWLEATAATSAEWFGSTEPKRNDNVLIQHPDLPMDTFGGKHQYAAYLFVQSVLAALGSPPNSPPGKRAWAFLKDSIEKSVQHDHTAGVDSAIGSALNESIGQAVAKFWADETNPKPLFAATARLHVHLLNGSEIISVNTARYLGADLESLFPEPNIAQVDVVVPKLPAGIEVSVNFGNAPGGNGIEEMVQKGQSFNETFCRTGYTPGTYPWPATGSVRLAITTTGKTPPATVKIKALTSSTKCPRQLRIVPGLSVGPLHLGFSKAEANRAAKPYRCDSQMTLPTGDTIQLCTYNEGPWFKGLPEAPVSVYFVNRRVGILFIADTGPQFSMPAGITTWTFDTGLNEYVPGSTLDDFRNSAPGLVNCSSIPYESSSRPTRGCWYEQATRYTFALNTFEKCTLEEISKGCYWPAPNYYVGLTGVATQKASLLVRIVSNRGRTARPQDFPLLLRQAKPRLACAREAARFPYRETRAKAWHLFRCLALLSMTHLVADTTRQVTRRSRDPRA
jgi:hypothetical protein